MPKILQINTVVNYGSTGRIAESIGDRIIEKNWKSIIAYGRYPRPSSSELIKIGSQHEILSHVVQTRLFDNHGFASKNSTKQLVKSIQKLNPDLIHLHNLHGYYLNIEVLFQYLAEYKKPVVWTFHDCWPMTGHCVHYDNINCDKWKTNCTKCPQLKEYPRTLFFDRTSKNHRSKIKLFNSIDNLTIVSVSNWLNEQVKESLLKSNKKKVIYNGIDTAVFKPKNNGVTAPSQHDNKFIILGVASVWSNNKGLQDFIGLNEKLSENEKIVLIGLSKKQIKQLPKNIIGIERTDSIEDLVNWYNTADVYFNPSVEETFGMTNAEALACGTPIIVYNATANPEMVVDGVGFVVQKKQVDFVYEKIKKIQSLGKSSFSEDCRNHVCSTYQLNDTYEQYINLYEDLIL